MCSPSPFEVTNICVTPPPPPPHALRDVIVTDPDEVTIGNERSLLFATAGGLIKCCSSPVGPGQSPGVGAGGEAPGSFEEPGIYSIKKGPKSR